MKCDIILSSNIEMSLFCDLRIFFSTKNNISLKRNIIKLFNKARRESGSKSENRNTRITFIAHFMNTICKKNVTDTNTQVYIHLYCILYVSIDFFIVIS